MVDHFLMIWNRDEHALFLLLLFFSKVFVLKPNLNPNNIFPLCADLKVLNNVALHNHVSLEHLALLISWY